MNSKLPPYKRQKSKYTGGFYGKHFPPNNPFYSNDTADMLPAFIVNGKASPVLGNGAQPHSPSALCCVNLPRGCVPLEHQVAGHTFQEGNPNEMGLLKRNDGTILKPAGKALCGEREIQFYENLKRESRDGGDLMALRGLVPRYEGIERLQIDGREVTFIKLEDLTDGMYEPCVMDVKIGRRTWDPLATAAKRAAEESKYVACKQNLGLCVPGFQVHSVKTGRCKRYGKEYGKRLTETTVGDALRLFLNADSGLCRSLVMQFLSRLWAIQSWARTQKRLRIYSSSVLLVYDARRLRSTLEGQRKRLHTQTSSNSSGSPTAVSSGSPLNGNVTAASILNSDNPFTFSQQHKTAKSPNLQRSPSLRFDASTPGTPTSPNGGGNGCGGEPMVSFKKIQRNHSVSNNYDQVRRRDVRSINNWATFLAQVPIGR